MAEPRELTEYQTDHDLIVGLSRDFKHVSEDIRELKEAVSKKNDDHEARIRKNENDITDMKSSSRTWRFVFSAIISVIGIGMSILGFVISFK